MRRKQDIDYVNKYKPDYVGFILSAGFKRTAEKNIFCEISGGLDKDIKKVGVFVNEDLENIKFFADKLDIIQLHGNENEEYINSLRKIFGSEIWKAVRAKSPEDIETADKLPCDKLLVDSYVKGIVGGSGVKADFEIIQKAKITKPFFLAGGLNSENIVAAIEQVKPYGVDFSGSVETDGFKDENKIKEIVDIIRSVCNE